MWPMNGTFEFHFIQISVNNFSTAAAAPRTLPLRGYAESKLNAINN